MGRKRLSAAGLFVTAMMVACATLPPAQPARDLKSIAGTWEGSVLTPRGTPLYHSTLTIREDGMYENLVPALAAPGPRFVGTVAVVDGQFRWTDATGLAGVFTLHEGDGKRVLTSDGRGTVGTAKWEPGK